jgi:excisionase family DNA binding protein
MSVTHADPDLLTTYEAAELARCSEATIRLWARTGRLQCLRWGPRRLVVPRGELFSLLKSRSVV